ncbi:MAG: type I DNA topoisomerase [Bacteroidales bacterium]|nr:type I DNA topoisomerase [Bacteroidales bacterium]
MEENLIIVESPTKAREIDAFLKKEKENYKVVSSRGHIRDLSEKRLSVDIEHGFAPEYEIPADKKRVVAELKALASKASTVYLASDPDREGEAIAWHLAVTLGLDPARTRRITYHEITKPAVLEALANPRDIDMKLVDAQQARRVLDRLVGFELSPVLWRKIQPKLSAGRVQSVALRLIVDREKEIMAFRSEPFYRVEGTFHPEGSPAQTKLKALLDSRFSSEDEARKFLEDSIGASYAVDGVEKKEALRHPAAPFTTSTLQQEASRKLHFPVSQTMRVAQSLYERGLITYMRTDSTTLSSLAINTTAKYISDTWGPSYSRPRQYKTKVRGAQEAHEAIRPTYISRAEIEGSTLEKRLYNLIWKRTVASQMADARVLNTLVRISSSARPETFSAQAVEVLFDGYMKLYGDDSEESGTVLPAVKKGDAMDAKSISAECKFTAPPQRYSQGTLTRKLEELEIGRPSTWGTIVPTLSSGRGYITEGDKEGVKIPVENLTLSGGRITASRKTETVGAEKRKLMPQDIGIIVSDFLVSEFPGIVDYDFTARVEEDFDRIAEGKTSWEKTISGFYTPFHKRIGEVIGDGKFSKVEKLIGNDPETGEPLIAKFGRFGAFVQKGDGEKKQFASLPKGTLIDSITVAQALKLFELPRTVGTLDGNDIVVTKGRFGPYIRFGDRNISVPRGKDPMKITLEECIELISADSGGKRGVIREADGYTIMQGPYGQYIKSGGINYKIPRGKNADSLTDEDCRKIIAAGAAAAKKKTRK